MWVTSKCQCISIAFYHYTVTGSGFDCHPSHFGFIRSEVYLEELASLKQLLHRLVTGNLSDTIHTAVCSEPVQVANLPDL